MSILEAVLLGIIEGLTEFLPVSSTGHLTIAEKLLGYRLNDPGVTAFTAIVQTGAILAVVWFFRRDILRLAQAWLAGATNRNKRGKDYNFAWLVIVGSLPIGIVGLLFKDQIEGVLRSLWFVGVALIVWSAVLWLADRTASLARGEDKISWKDTVVVGAAQCLALIPGVSRSGATIAAGLFEGLDRLSATRLSFFLSVPALLAAGAFEAAGQFSAVSQGVGWLPTIVATVVSFAAAYTAIAWLIRYVAGHNFNVFVIYRVLLGFLLIILLASGTISAV